MSASTHPDARRVRGLLLAFVLVVSQATAWCHAVAIAHVACPEHGEAMHGGAMPAGAGVHVHVDDGRAAPGVDRASVRGDVATASGHDHCANAALLRWRDVALTAPAGLASLALASRPFAPAPSHDRVRAGVLYLVAPKTSPPSRSV